MSLRISVLITQQALFLYAGRSFILRFTRSSAEIELPTVETSLEAGMPSSLFVKIPSGWFSPVPLRIPFSNASVSFSTILPFAIVSIGNALVASSFFVTVNCFTRSVGESSRFPYSKDLSEVISDDGISFVHSAADASAFSYGTPRLPAPLTEIFLTRP